MRTASVADVKNDLSRFVALARRGERVRILVRGVPAADLVPIEASGSSDGDDEEAELAELESLGMIRRGAPLSAADLRSLDKPGPRVRGGRAVEVLLEERRRR